MKQFYAIFILTGFILVFGTGCRSRKTDVIQYRLKRGNYVDKITVPATLKAVNSRFIKTPMLGFINVDFLAEDGAIVKKGDTVCILDGPELIDRLETFSLNHEKLLAEMNKIAADQALALSMLEAQMKENEIQVAINSLDSIQRKFAPPVRQKLMELELEKAEINQDKLKKKVAARKRINETEIRGMRSRIRQMENQIQRMQDQVDMLTVLAPADGMVMHTESPQMYFMSNTGTGMVGGKIEEGSSVFTDMPLLEMPDMSKMQASVEVSEGDFKRIESGQRAQIRVDAAGKNMFTGSVQKKMPVGRQVSRDSELKIYEVIVSIDSSDVSLVPGLSASCDIILHEVGDAVVVPTFAIHEQDSSRFIYVARNNKYVRVAIETGLSNSTESIVSKGLRGDETIALTQPPVPLILRKTRVHNDSADSSFINKTTLNE